MELPDGLLTLLRRPSLCFVATLMPDGSPQLTQTWVDTDGEHVLINTVRGHQKVRNIERDPRVALDVADHDRPARYYAIRGRVLKMTTDGAARRNVLELNMTSTIESAAVVMTIIGSDVTGSALR